MASRRKSKRSMSLRTTSFIRLLSPFRVSGTASDREDGSQEDAVQEVSKEAWQTSFSGRPLASALSDSHLNVQHHSKDSGGSLLTSEDDHHHLGLHLHDIMLIITL